MLGQSPPPPPAAHVANVIAMAFGVAGGLCIAFGAYVVLRGVRLPSRLERAVERGATLAGFLLIGAAFGLQLIVQAGRLFR